MALRRLLLGKCHDVLSRARSGPGRSDSRHRRSAMIGTAEVRYARGRWPTAGSVRLATERIGSPSRAAKVRNVYFASHGARTGGVCHVPAVRFDDMTIRRRRRCPLPHIAGVIVNAARGFELFERHLVTRRCRSDFVDNVRRSRKILPRRQSSRVPGSPPRSTQFSERFWRRALSCLSRATRASRDGGVRGRVARNEE